MLDPRWSMFDAPAGGPRLSAFPRARVSPVMAFSPGAVALAARRSRALNRARRCVLWFRALSLQSSAGTARLYAAFTREAGASHPLANARGSVSLPLPRSSITHYLPLPPRPSPISHRLSTPRLTRSARSLGASPSTLDLGLWTLDLEPGTRNLEPAPSVASLLRETRGLAPAALSPDFRPWTFDFRPPASHVPRQPCFLTSSANFPIWTTSPCLSHVPWPARAELTQTSLG